MKNFRDRLPVGRLQLLLVPLAVLVAVLIVVLVLLSGGGEDGPITISPPGWNGEPTSAAPGEGDGTPTAIPSADAGSGSPTVPSGDGDVEPVTTPRPSSVERFLEPYKDKIIMKSACEVSGDLREADCGLAGEYRLEPPPTSEKTSCVALRVEEAYIGLACAPQPPVSIASTDVVYYVIPQ